MKASFFDRLIAYLIDVIIIAAVATVIVSFVPTSNTKDFQKEINIISEKLVAGDISANAYISEVSGAYYELDKNNIPSAIIGIFISMMYFMYYQFKNGGRTFGKKLLKLKIIKREGELELNDLVVRSLLIDNILCSMLLLIVIFIANEDNYYVIKSSVESLQMVFIVVAAFMILFREDKRGLHDLICKTSVIKYEKEV